jgi:ABC-type uncharacterized transport system substrate-binding protein
MPMKRTLDAFFHALAFKIGAVIVLMIVMLLYLLSPAYTIAGSKYAGKKVLYVDSYHAGYAWSDGIAGGIREIFMDTGIELRRIEMDTKRNTSEEFKKAAAVKVKGVIAEFKPDVVIASDDNAAKYLIMPYYKDVDLAIVFCGLNWDASAYGFPYRNVTGMVEIALVPQILKQLKKYARGDRIGFLGDDTLTSRKNLQYHRDLLKIHYDYVYYVNNFAEWQRKYIELQDKVDLMILINYVGIPDWDKEKAQVFVENHTKIPAGTNNTWTIPFSLLGIIKSPEEQGGWAARAALKILDGTAPDKIPITHNKQGKLYYNLRIGKKLGITKAPAGAIVIE